MGEEPHQVVTTPEVDDTADPQADLEYQAFKAF
jgi:hypothetical protein